MPANEMDSEIEEPERTGWSRALRESPVVCPDLAARVQGRIVRVRAVRRSSLAAAAVLVVVGWAWIWSPVDTKPMLAIEKTPAKTQPKSPRGDSLAVPSPVAQMSILDDQQAALWAGLEKLTEDL